MSWAFITMILNTTPGSVGAVATGIASAEHVLHEGIAHGEWPGQRRGSTR